MVVERGIPFFDVPLSGAIGIRLKKVEGARKDISAWSPGCRFGWFILFYAVKRSRPTTRYHNSLQDMSCWDVRYARYGRFRPRHFVPSDSPRRFLGTLVLCLLAYHGPYILPLPSSFSIRF